MIAPLSTRKLLVVDDDESTLAALQAFFERHGWQVESADSVTGAVNLIAHGFVPDAVVSDWRLAGNKNGIDLIRDVKRFKPDCQCYMISGYSLDDLRRALGLLGVNGIFSKPVPLQALLQHMEDLHASAPMSGICRDVSPDSGRPA